MTQHSTSGLTLVLDTGRLPPCCELRRRNPATGKRQVNYPLRQHL